MAFTESELREDLNVLETVFWSHHRPPERVRDRMRDGQRITGQAIELFFIRPAFERPGEFV